MPSPLPPARPPQEPVREVPVCLDESGGEHARSVLSPTHFKVRAGCMLLPRLVVPVVFLPGVMGTRLRLKDRKKVQAWAPPENTWEKICALFSYLGKNAARRQELLDPENTEVDPDGLCRPDPDTAPLLAIAAGANADEQAVSRGWGALHGDSYAKILSALERYLAHCFVEEGARVEPLWQAEVLSRQGAESFGAEKAFSALTEGELWLTAQAAYPVHAVGYNWLRSNRESGEHLAAEIRRITDYYAQRRRICEKVILVTHSMGGLVARACAEVAGLSDKILGIVHGVQPAIGAPAAYKRMRAGFEGPEQVVLGRNAAECTAVLAHAPGPLELLPHAQYRARGEDGRERHWLRASHRDATGEERSVPLGEGDPFEAIYLRSEEACWWRMVKEELIDPKGEEERKKSGEMENRKASGFGDFATALGDARKLHDAIQDKYHSVTYAFYAADAAQRTWNEAHWRSKRMVSGPIETAPLAEDDLNGKVVVTLEGAPCRFDLQGPRGPGDGTVPAESGQAPKPHARQIFRHEGEAKGHQSYDHQKAFDAREPLAVTLYSIAKIAAGSDWFKEQAEKS